MIPDLDFLEMLNKWYPNHSFMLAEIEHGRTLYLDGKPIKVSWLHNSADVDATISTETRMAINQTVIDACHGRSEYHSQGTNGNRSQ